MWIEAIVSLEDFQSLAAELFPLRVHLGDADSDHYLFLSAMTDVSLVEGRGLRVVCHAQVRWPVLGMDLPINVDSLTVMLEPSVPDESGELLIGMQLEHADVAWVPSLIDAKIVSAINESLKKRHTELCFSFARTLSHDFALPEMLHPLRALSLKAGWGKVRITSEAMVLVISFHAHALARLGAPAAAESAAPLAPALVPASPTLSDRPAPAVVALSDRPSPAVVALGTTVALVSTYFLARLTYGLVTGGGRRHHLV